MWVFVESVKGVEVELANFKDYPEFEEIRGVWAAEPKKIYALLINKYYILSSAHTFKLVEKSPKKAMEYKDWDLKVGTEGELIYLQINGGEKFYLHGLSSQKAIVEMMMKMIAAEEYASVPKNFYYKGELVDENTAF